MRALEEFQNEELLETLEHGLDEFESEPVSSLGFTIRVASLLLSRLASDEELVTEAANLIEYASDLLHQVRGRTALTDEVEAVAEDVRR